MSEENKDSVPENDNQTQEAVPANPSEEELQKREKLFQENVLFLLDQLRRMFDPNTRMTFIVRDPSDSTRHMVMTDETNWADFIKAATNINPSVAIDRKIAPDGKLD